MSARDTNFYYSFLVLPAEKRRAIVAVWDFCRAVDDATDEVGAGDETRAADELARWRQELGACFEGGLPQTPQGLALVPYIGGRFIHDLVDGLSSLPAVFDGDCNRSKLPQVR